MTQDKDQWGNIELPGLSDEELFGKNWNMVRNSANLVKNLDWKTNHKNGIQNRSCSDWREKTAVANKKKAHEQINRQNYLAGIEKRNQSAKFLDQLKQNGTKRKKPIQVPWGLFDSRKSAVEYAKKNNITNALGKIQKGLIANPDQYYYIEKKSES